MGSVIGLDSIRFVGRLRSGIDWLKRELQPSPCSSRVVL